ncbi:MAG TPA: EVE domain-containing protein [Bdellovibrionota bacterium]|jgi:predicted RNA-binding protein with PUA-like domain
MNHWLMKCEPDVYSIADLKKDKRTGWEGVRNYQARNFMRDGMKVGDFAFFYHSNAEPSGVAGIARIVKTGLADPTQFDRKSEYFDPKSTKEKPTWIMVEIEFVEEFPYLLPLEKLRNEKALTKMALLQKGSRLSVQPVTKPEWDCVVGLGHKA